MRGTLLKLAGSAAIAGGALRIANAFTTGMLDEHTLQLLYFATDFFFVLGLIGIYAPRSEVLGALGLIGFIVSILGFLIIRSATLMVFGMGGYLFGATVALLGVATLSIAMLLKKNGSRWPPIIWLLALALGIASTFGLSIAALAAGIAFGAGFVAAGFELIAA